ncbi:MAG: alanine--tRNA ligase [Phycisphaeraceae bacterium]|nr:alanine--tRNA ligase [Phycisphaeraceae bacterium]
MTLSARQIRQTFLDFFCLKKGHAFVPSSPCVPVDDPTLLFTNAGMNQFKPIFLGQADPASEFGRLKRAANSQKCIRAGGKHNDLEDVGRDTYHHTFFEMLGNWSFGDYFKDEAIAWSFELLTEVLKIDPSRLYATYFEGNAAAGLAPDHETRDLWLRYLPADHVLPGNMKDNFWEMGDTGPCGPCSEIHYDRIGGRNAAAMVNSGDPDVLEIWNNVFIQFNREADGGLKPLPARHVDTGMGFERLVSVLQNKRSNYDTDVFAPYFKEIQKATGARPYQGKLGSEDEGLVDTAYRVIADHLRTLTFAITDGATPSNEGRGYVLRRILRRAVRFGRQMLHAPSGFFAELVPVVVETMGAAFPELKKNPGRVQEMIREEEESFGRTLDRGIQLFELARMRAEDDKLQRVPPAPMAPFVGKNSPAHEVTASEMAALEAEDIAMAQVAVISAADAFQLYDTYGFPLDLTVLMAEERGLKVDVEGFNRLMEEQRERSRSGGKADEHTRLILDGEAVAHLRAQGIEPTDDSAKYTPRDMIARVRAIWNGTDFDTKATVLTGVHDRVGLVLDRTCFYAEAGGQTADVGRMHAAPDAQAPLSRRSSVGGEFRVEEVHAFGGYVLHIGRVTDGEILLDARVQLHLDRGHRAGVASNHTATHLLNWALREHLGEHVDQKGSLVAADRLRFDFANPGPVADDRLPLIEQAVREQIARDLPVFADTVPLALAQKVRGLRAVFGEKYPDPVRMVSIGVDIPDLVARPDNEAWQAVSIEFCGGTHVQTTSELGAFALLSETGIAKGVRRVEAVTGVPALAAIDAADRFGEQIGEVARLRDEELPPAVADLAAQLETLTLPLVRRHELRGRLAELHERVKAAAKAAARGRAAAAVEQARSIAESAARTGERFVVAVLPLGDDRQAMQQAANVIGKACAGAAVMLISTDEEADKVAVLAYVPTELVAQGLKAGDWVRAACEACGGKGGGKPEQAQGGGTGVARAPAVAEAARAFAGGVLGGRSRA